MQAAVAAASAVAPRAAYEPVSAQIIEVDTAGATAISRPPADFHLARGRFLADIASGRGADAPDKYGAARRALRSVRSWEEETALRIGSGYGGERPITRQRATQSALSNCARMSNRHRRHSDADSHS